MSTDDDNSKRIEDEQRQQQRMLQQQIEQSNAEIEQKRQSVFNERLNIIRSQGALNWSPPATPTNVKPGKPPKQPKAPRSSLDNPIGTTPQ